MGRGSSKVGAITLNRGLSSAENQELHDKAMGSLVWRDNYAGTNVTTAEERQKYGNPWGNGGSEFEHLQFDMLQTVAERNNVQDDFIWDDVRANVRSSDRRFEVKGDDYAIARENADRMWIVNEYDLDSTAFYKPIIDQNRFSTPEAALEFVVRRRK